MTSTTHDTDVEQDVEPAGASPSAGESLEIVCLSPQPWNVDLPTNRQQIMVRAAARGHRVLYVDTGEFLGRRLVGWLRGRASSVEVPRLPEGIRLLSALNVAPWGHRFQPATRLNAALTSMLLRRRTSRGTRPVVLWIYDPCFAPCIGRVGERLAVYDCVDDYAEQTSGDRRKSALVSFYDRLAASRARLVFATAQPLVDRHLQNNSKTYLVPNVGDFGHFAPAVDRAISDPAVTGLPRPVVGFAGNVHAAKMDLDLVEHAARLRPHWTFLLIGPVRDDALEAMGRIAALDNVRVAGQVSYEALPRYVAAMDVGVIPYLANAYTRSCFPLKTFEYLAAGKPVVATGLPELRGREPHVVVAEGVDSFVRAIEAALDEPVRADVEGRRTLAAANTWETRTERLLELVAAEL